VQEKNADELLQQFVWNTRAIDVSAAKKDPNDVLPVDNDKARSDAQLATQHLRTLFSLILTNGEVRKLLGDFSVVGRDLLARGVVKLAEQTRPDEESLQRVDEPGPDNEFISEGGRRVGHDETPVPEARIPGTGTTVAQHPREELGRGAAVKQEDGQVKSGDQAFNETQQRKDELQDRAGVEAQRQKEDIQQQLSSSESDSDTPNGWRGRFSGMKSSLTGRVPQKHKDTANEHYSNVKNFLSDEYFPEERRDQLIFRFKKVCARCMRFTFNLT